MVGKAVKCKKCGKIFYPVGKGRYRYCGQCRDVDGLVRKVPVKKVRRRRNGYKFRCLASKCVNGTQRRRGRSKCKGCEWNSRNYKNAHFMKRSRKYNLLKNVDITYPKLKTMDRTIEGSLPIEITIRIERKNEW
jgi:hypothetical protein